MIKLSIITINYNNASGLKKTLESIACQRFSDYEQIIIDGGSTDESVKIIQNYSQTTKQQLIWVSEPDSGVYNAQNKGIQRASGEYCLFLNSEDYLINEQVLDLVFEKEITEDIIYGNLVVISKNTKIGTCKGKNHITFLDIYSSLIKHQASFIKRDLFIKYGFYDENLKIVADWAFFFKVIGFHNISLKYVDIDIACFDNNGISNNNPELCKKERQLILDQYLPAIMQEDFILLQKYKGVRLIDQSRWGKFLFRVLAKILKILH